ncbi:MAG TPA: hypothetical protein VHR41_16925 [Gemmatimonadales bacterium]|jgi:hypothetical protein|nr:hypothetical protein [Gemmatimonadales bacterium]
MRWLRAPIAVVGRVRCPASRLARLAGLLLLVPQLLPAQSVTPPIAEYQEHASSSFRLSNGSLYPLNVVLEVRGFRVTEQGEVVDVPLDTTRLHLKLSAMSFRIPPRASYTVFYEASADSLPAWFNIISAMTGARSDNGLNVRILLPHVVYLNQKRRLESSDVLVRTMEMDSSGRRVRVELENRSDRLGRIIELTATDGHARSGASGGFPIFPHSLRWVESSWAGAEPPTRVMVRTAKFTLDTMLAPPISAAAP